MIPRLTSYPKRRTPPAVEGMAAVTILNEVDLPAPFGPSRPKIYPRLTSNEIFLRATCPLPYTLLMP